MRAVPITLREANAFVEQWHRHMQPVNGCKFCIGCMAETHICGVIIVARPVSRMLDDGMTAEVSRCCTDGERNAASFLYRCAWRAASAMGYEKLTTYTLQEESGASLRGAGFKLIGKRGGGTWARRTRPRIDTHPLQEKLRWEISEP